MVDIRLDQRQSQCTSALLLFELASFNYVSTNRLQYKGATALHMGH